MKIALIGSRGYWGGKFHRVLTELGHDIVPIDHDNLDLIETASAAIIATPPHTHHCLAMRAMLAGLDVLVEKPLALTSADAFEMIQTAAGLRRVLSVDATFLHTAAFDYLDATDELLLSYQSIRLAPPMLQAKIGAGWDLIVHDLSILHRLDALRDGSGLEDGPVASATLRLLGGGHAFMFGSRSWPDKVRSAVLHYPSGVYHWTLEGLHNANGAWVVRETEEPLKRVVNDFVRRIENRELTGISDGIHGWEVVKCLELLFPQAS